MKFHTFDRRQWETIKLFLWINSNALGQRWTLNPWYISRNLRPLAVLYRIWSKNVYEQLTKLFPSTLATFLSVFRQDRNFWLAIKNSLHIITVGHINNTVGNWFHLDEHSRGSCITIRKNGWHHSDTAKVLERGQTDLRVAAPGKMNDSFWPDPTIRIPIWTDLGFINIRNYERVYIDVMHKFGNHRKVCCIKSPFFEP